MEKMMTSFVDVIEESDDHIRLRVSTESMRKFQGKRLVGLYLVSIFLGMFFVGIPFFVFTLPNGSSGMMVSSSFPFIFFIIFGLVITFSGMLLTFLGMSPQRKRPKSFDIEWFQQVSEAYRGRKKPILKIDTREIDAEKVSTLILKKDAPAILLCAEKPIELLPKIFRDSVDIWKALFKLSQKAGWELREV